MHWRLPTRIAFRFCVVYFGLFCLAFAQITFVFTGVLSQWLPDRAVLWQMLALEPVTGWVGRT
ncbi:MAG TPA: DoxX family protein, partial [Mycobacterium sp.]|nr:DoxX family protein [Mycobacterium sp.]